MEKSEEETEENAIGLFFDRCSRSGSSPLEMVYFFSGVNKKGTPLSQPEVPLRRHFMVTVRFPVSRIWKWVIGLVGFFVLLIIALA
ncbi:MAG: hypothetical protein EHM37_12895 [Deltaproteobacteria bacterium]|nr:MAG: hypothetical protein EHM37_12895 [Deltaproteobacteria bacterium]